MINPYEASTDQDTDRAAEFMELLTPRQGQIWGYIYATISNAADAQDVYQQTVMALWRKFDTFQPGTNFAAWALTTAYYEVQMYRRASSRSKLLFSDDLVALLTESQRERLALAHDPSDRMAELRGCLGKLKQGDRELIRMCYEDRTPIIDMARQLGRTSQSICNSLRRIRISLLRCIDATNAQA